MSPNSRNTKALILHKEKKASTNFRLTGLPRFWMAFLVLCMFGNFVFLVSPTFSFLNISALVLLPFLVIAVIRTSAGAAGWMFGLGLVLMTSLCLVVWLNDPSYANGQAIRNSIVLTFCSVLAIYWNRNFSEHLLYSVGAVLLATLMISLLQLSFELTGFGLEAKLSEEWRQYGQKGFEIGFPSVFGNPNDYSAFVLAVFLFLVRQRASSKAFFLVLVCGIALLLSGSRSALFIYLLGFSFFRGPFKYVLIPVSMGLAVIVWLLAARGIDTGFYAIDRFVEVVRLSATNANTGDSLWLRTQSYIFFFGEYWRFLFGSFTFERTCPQFAFSGLGNDLLIYSPHSFLIELHCAFGFLGAIIFGLLFFSGAVTLVKAKLQTLLIGYFVLSIFIITSVPSSVFSSGQIFFMIVLAVTQCTQRQFVRIRAKDHDHSHHNRPLTR